MANLTANSHKTFKMVQADLIIFFKTEFHHWKYGVLHVSNLAFSMVTIPVTKLNQLNLHQLYLKLT